MSTNLSVNNFYDYIGATERNLKSDGAVSRVIDARLLVVAIFNLIQVMIR